MAYCLKCGKPMRGHGGDWNTTMNTVNAGKPTWECLNDACPNFKLIKTETDIIDEITYLIQELNLIKKTLGMG